MSLSVIIPTKNRAKLLSLCLSSLANQTVSPEEIIIIDNNSTDQTRLVIKKMSQFLPIIKLFSSIKNYPKLYNLGIKRANGSIIACLDDDCWVEQDWVEQIITAHQTHQSAAIQGMIKSYPSNNIYVEIMSQHYQSWIKNFTLPDNSLSVLDSKNVSFPKKIIMNNLFDESLKNGSHDIELGARLSTKKIKIHYETQVVAYHKERTTFIQFFNQHWRIAKSEAILKKKIKTTNIKIIFSQKNFLSFLKLIKKITKKIIRFKFLSALHIFFIYFILLFVRIIGFIHGYIIDFFSQSDH